MRSSATAFALLGLLALACAAPTDPEFEAAKAAALAPAPPLASDWRPDLLLFIAPRTLDALAARTIGGAEAWSSKSEISAGPLGKIVVTPNLVIKKTTVRGTRACEGCVDVTVDLEGRVDWKSPLGDGGVPVKSQLQADIQVEMEQEGGEWVARSGIHDIRKLTIDLGSARGLPPQLEQELIKRVKQRLLEEATPMEMTRFPADLPIRGVRVVSGGEGVGFAFRTSANASGSVPLHPTTRTDGFELRVNEPTLLALARKAAFEAGPLDYGLLVEPRGIDFDGDGFTLDMRIWQTGRVPWWRDYQAKGKILIERNQIALRADDVQEVAASPGATAANPLAALGRGVILTTIADTLNQAVPPEYGKNRARTDAAGLPMTIRLQSASGTGGHVRVQGGIALK